MEISVLFWGVLQGPSTISTIDLVLRLQNSTAPLVSYMYKIGGKCRGVHVLEYWWGEIKDSLGIYDLIQIDNEKIYLKTML